MKLLILMLLIGCYYLLRHPSVVTLEVVRIQEITKRMVVEIDYDYSQNDQPCDYSDEEDDAWWDNYDDTYGVNTLEHESYLATEEEAHWAAVDRYEQRLIWKAKQEQAESLAWWALLQAQKEAENQQYLATLTADYLAAEDRTDSDRDDTLAYPLSLCFSNDLDSVSYNGSRRGGMGRCGERRTTYSDGHKVMKKERRKVQQADSWAINYCDQEDA